MKNFEDLAGHSKVWIYQSNKPFNDIDIAEISTATEVFINSWQSHGSEMNASFKVFYDRFLVVALDETSAGASGCGIDKLFHHIKKLESTLQINFFDRLIIYYVNQDVIGTNPLKDISLIQQTHFSSLKDSSISPSSLIFDNTISVKEELNSNWLVKADKSWLATYLEFSENI
jgi:hypothetical protein